MNSSVTLAQRDLGDVELVLGDQPEQQVERTLEVVEVHLEARRAAGGRTSRGTSTSSRDDDLDPTARRRGRRRSWTVSASGGVPAGDELAGELAVGVGARVAAARTS